MSAGEEKKFVIKHVFTDFKNLKMNTEHRGNQEYHFDVPWFIDFNNCTEGVYVYLNCPKMPRNEEYTVETEIGQKLGKKTGEKETISFRNWTYSHSTTYVQLKIINTAVINDYLINGSFEVECIVKIKSMIGIKPLKLRSFDESAKEFSDVVLVVKDQKFCVNKMYLTSHSSYFKALFLGNFDESKQSEVELKDIEPSDFQNFLELIYGESLVDDDTVDGILKLADMYDARTAIRRCENFLLNSSKKSLKEKFDLATLYKLDNVMKKCISEMKTVEDLRSIVPKDAEQYSYDLWKTLLEKSFTFCK